MGKLHRWGPVVLVAALVLVACGDDGGSESSSVPDAAAIAGGTGSTGVRSATVASGTSGATASPGGATAPSSGSTAPLRPSADVVYTGSLDVRVAKVDVAARDAQQKVTALGGYLFSQRSSSVEGAPSATLVFKLPPGAFAAAVDQLATLGTEVARNVQADDVSAQVVDLESRLKTAQSSLDRTRVLLDRASNITDIVTLEREVASRETTVEQLTGQLRVIRAQVAAATLTLTIGEKLKDVKPTPSKNIPGVLEGLRGGAVALWNTVRVVALILAALLPWALLAFVLWWLGSRAYRRVAPRVERRRERFRARQAARRPVYAEPFFATYRPGPPAPSRPAPPEPPAPPTEAVPDDPDRGDDGRDDRRDGPDGPTDG